MKVKTNSSFLWLWLFVSFLGKVIRSFASSIPFEMGVWQLQAIIKLFLIFNEEVQVLCSMLMFSVLQLRYFKNICPHRPLILGIKLYAHRLQGHGNKFYFVLSHYEPPCRPKRNLLPCHVFIKTSTAARIRCSKRSIF